MKNTATLSPRGKKMPVRDGETRSARVEATIRRRIEQGIFRPGQRLVRRTLAREMGVSTLPVIEALHRLEREGLVEHETNSGARVRSLTMEQVRDDLVLREAIESQVARLLAGRLGPVTLDELRERAGKLDESMQKSSTWNSRGMHEHAAFHLELARLTGRPVLLSESRKVWSRRFTQLAWIDAAVTRKVPRDWHRRLVDALAGGDPRAADEAARYHIRRAPGEHRQVMAEMAAALDALRRKNQEIFRLGRNRDSFSEDARKPGCAGKRKTGTRETDKER